MKFRKISERVRGGKLDPLSKMGKSKLTGQEVAKYYKDNPDSFKVVKPTDLIMDYLTDIEKLLKKE